uniref:Coiled-coil domain-containing protein 150 isoform X5 n=1 Tax=Phascolarctos cinereus TaxID=38626 RepID=A0A6P5KXF6_PHACI|nr:coiled-coil domain-containing protein 150 isoform X5 [Phascolarctos cinereus]
MATLQLPRNLKMDLNIATARAVLSPVNLNAATPEAFTVLQKRMKIAEEQSNTLMNDLIMLGLTGQSLQTLSTVPLEDSENQKIIHPLQARGPFVGENNVLWKNCETLVNNMCQLESIMQNLKAKISQLQNKTEFNPQNSVYMKDQLNALQEEHPHDLGEMHLEVMNLHKQLRDMKKEGNQAQDEVQRLSTTLEITTATKLREQLSQEKNLRESLEESQEAMLCRVQDMETTVELEREQVKALQQDCLTLRKSIETTQEQLHQEQQRAAQLESDCAKLRTELRSKDDVISQLLEDGKTLYLSFNQEHKETTHLKSEMASLQETAKKVQMLNDRLNKQCSDLNNKLQTVTMENVRLIADHQAFLKAEQEKVTQKLQEQDLMLDATRTSIAKELQNVQNERTQLQKCLDALHLEHSKCKQKAKEVEKRTTTQKELQEYTIVRLRGELEVALKERKSLLKGRENLHKELKKTESDRTQEKSKLEMELKKNKEEMSALIGTLQALEKENRQLMDRMTTMEHQKVVSENHEHTQQQVKKVLGKITDSKNKLSYEKGKLQTKVKQLQKEINSLADARSENDELRKLNKALETKYAQMQTILEKNEDDFSRAIKSRDVSSRESHKMRGHLEALEERERSKMGNFQRQLAEAKEDNCKVTIMLENVLASHSKMQGALEKVQMELGRRDSEISDLKKERLLNQQKVQKLEAELDEWQSRLLIVEAQHNSEVEPLHNALDVSREDNRKLALSLEQALQTNGQLQQMLDRIQEKLDSKEIEQQTLENYKEQVAEESKMQAEMTAERIDSLRKQFQSERETVRKAAQRETNEEMGETIRHLRKCKEVTEHKLKEASAESEQITANLEEAHRWFKCKFDGLQLELSKNRLQRLPQDNKWKEDMTFADGTSRYNRVPAQSALHRWETKQQLRYLSKKYQPEMSRK